VLSIILGGIVMLAAGTVVVLPKLLLSYATKNIPKVNALPDPPPSIDGPINILMLGMDQRGTATDDSSRADTIIIAHIPASHDALYLVSIPRDTEVAIPPDPEAGYAGEDAQKINAAFAIGAGDDLSPDGRGRGGALTAQTIDQLVPGGLKFNAMAIINFDGFLGILNVLGGVDMYVDEDTYSIHYYEDGSKPAKGDIPVGEGKFYKKGQHHFAPWEALDYARQRESLPDSDYGRQRHQQQLMKAIMGQLASKGTLTDVGKLLDLQKAAGDLLTLDLGPVGIDEWVFTLRGLNPNNMVMIKTNAGQFNKIDINGHRVSGSNQALTQDSMDMLAAVSKDTLADFLAQHPDFVAQDK